MVNPLTNDEIESYRSTGWLVARNALSSEEVTVLQAETRRLLASPELTDPNNIRSGHRTINDEVRVEKLDPVHDVSPVLADLVADERILSPLRDLFNDEPKLFKDKLIFKLPGQTGYAMHQDASWWQGFPYENLVSVMVAVDSATAENGAVEFFPGQHQKLRSTPGELRNMNESERDAVDTSNGQILETQAGDLVFFSSLVPHRSGTNTADVSRSQLYLTYSPASSGDLYKAHYQHYRRYAYGAQLSDPANPLHYR